jgi:hypothetical protein
VLFAVIKQLHKSAPLLRRPGKASPSRDTSSISDPLQQRLLSFVVRLLPDPVLVRRLPVL